MASKGILPKLTAILSADVVGYSRLMEFDEEATLETLTAYRKVSGYQIKRHRRRANIHLRIEREPVRWR